MFDTMRLLKNNFLEEKKVDIWRCSEAAPPDIRPFSSKRLLFQRSHTLILLGRVIRV